MLHELVGHRPERASLAEAHASGLLPPSILVHGLRGIGKQRFALWLAQLHVCERPEPEPCGSCRPCRLVLALEHPDVHWYFPLPRPKSTSAERLADALEDARIQALAERREQPLRPSHTDEVQGLYLATVRNIRSRAHLRATMSTGPFFVIGEAEMLVPQESSPEAANALLKLLEEPPGGARFVLTSSEPGRLPATIRSRTVPLHLSPLRSDEVTACLERYAGVTSEVATWAATIGRGSLGRSLGFVPDGEELGPLESLRRRAFEIVDCATAGDPAAAYRLPLDFPPSGARKLMDLLGFVEEWLRDLGAVATGAHAAVIHGDATERLRSWVTDRRIDAADVPRCFALVDQARELSRANVNPQLVVSGLLRGLRGALRSASPSATAVPS